MSSTNVDVVGLGCPTAALPSDVAREAVDSPVQNAFHEGVERLLGILTEIAPPGSALAKRKKALVNYATMVGALVMARATKGGLLSDEFLSAAREHFEVPPTEALQAQQLKATPEQLR